jgi:hypothetical protein
MDPVIKKIFRGCGAGRNALCNVVMEDGVIRHDTPTSTGSNLDGLRLIHIHITTKGLVHAVRDDGQL